MMKKLITILLALMLLISASGCAEEEKLPAPIGSEVWETMPQLTYGVMEYEKLQILPWNSGRCEATSFDSWAETENGYYMSPMSHLLYADKADLHNWIAVCNNPDCMHTDSKCNAYVQYREFVIQNDRIYFQMVTGDVPELYSGGASMFLASMAGNGSDKRFEYACEKYIPTTTARYMSFLTSQYYIYNVVGLNEDGTQTAYAYLVTRDGQETVTTVDNFENPTRIGATVMSGRSIPLYGDRLILSGVLCESNKTYLRNLGKEQDAVDISQLPAKYGYLSGDTLRYFQVNDGYYDINIKTGDKVKLADAQLENSFASIVLPNCILESTLMAYNANNSTELYTEDMEHEMRFFDGQKWHSVVLPNELAHAGGKIQMRIAAVTSDKIILSVVDFTVSNRTTHYYAIDLTADTLSMVYMMEYTS